MATLERLIGTSSFLVSLDPRGRLALPEEFARQTKIQLEALLVGRLDRFEIWDPETFNTSQRDSVIAEDLARRLEW